MRRSASAARLAGILALFACSICVAAQASEERGLPFPFELERPQDAQKVEIKPGARILHLVFFATWCSPCLEELRGLGDLEAKWVDRGYRLVLVAVPARQSRERLTSFLREASPPGEVLFDRDGAVQKACGVDRLPTHLLVGSKGEVLLRARDLGDGVGAAVERLLEPTRRRKETGR